MTARAEDRSLAGDDRRLVRQFIAGAAITIAVAMTFLAYAISDRIAAGMMHRAAEDGAMLIDAVLGPTVQELATSSSLSPEAIARLDDILKTQLADRVMAMKIWLRDGTIVYANNKQLIGRQFAVPALEQVFAGQARGHFDSLDDAENQHERLLQIPLIEIYAPLYQRGADRIIAAGEFYTNGEKFAADLHTIRLTAVAIVGAVAAPMMLVLFLMVRRASAMVKAHQDSLTRKMLEAQELARQNDELRRSAEESRLEAARSNERLLDQIGQDLHDGPIQLLSLLMLKLTDTDEELPPSGGDNGKPKTACRMPDAQDLAARVLKDIRDISSGLVLPQLDGLTTTETIWLAIRQHEHVTGTDVTCRIGTLPDDLSRSSKICLFRTVQEGLNNAFQHAGGRGQEIEASADADWITLIVRDAGGGPVRSEPRTRRGRPGLGLAGLRRRIESLQGTFEVSVRSDTGSEIRTKLPAV